MFYLVRQSDTKDPLGILNVREILEMIEDYDPRDIASILRSVAYRNVKHQKWYLDHISQAEYETYRDLHRFRVFT